jgi:uncharacterized protein (DUF302 family)
MRFILILTALVLAMPAFARANAGMVTKRSPHTVAETLDRLQEVLESKGIGVFQRVDHAANAEKAGLTLPPTQLLIFGNPKLGTPLMQANRKIGVDLPMKALAWEDEDGQVWLGYVKPEELKDRHDIDGHDEIFDKMTGALDAMTNAALEKE